MIIYWNGWSGRSQFSDNDFVTSLKFSRSTLPFLKELMKKNTVADDVTNESFYDS